MDLLEEAIAAWQKTREPRWGQVADWAGRALPPLPLIGAGKKKADRDAWDELEKKRDAKDLPRLVKALAKWTSAEAADRVKILAHRNDPRLFTELLGILEAPPWRANVYKDFVTAVLEVLAATADPRVEPAFTELSKRYRGIIETSVGDWVSSKLSRAATMQFRDEIRASKLTDAEAAKLAAAEARFADQISAQKTHAADRKVVTRNDDELLAAIYAEPTEDGPRLVYADALSERGDLRGELINLQIRHAHGDRTLESELREVELLADPKRKAAWALPLIAGGDCVFERGFTGRLTLRAKTASKIKGDAALATVTSLAGLEQVSGKMAAEFLDHPALAKVLHVGQLRAEAMQRLALRPRPWKTLRLFDEVPRPLAPCLSEVRTLKFEHSPEAPPAASLLPFAKVTDLAFHGRGFMPEHLAVFSRLERLSLGWGATLPEALDGLSTLRWLEVFFPVLPATVKGLKLEELRANFTFGSTAEVRPLVEALPTLKTLFLGSTRETSLLTLADAVAGTAVQTLDINFGHSVWRVQGDSLTMLRMPYSPDQFVDVLTPMLEAKRVRRVRIGPEKSVYSHSMPSDARLAPIDLLLEKHGLKLERDWLL